MSYFTKHTVDSANSTSKIAVLFPYLFILFWICLAIYMGYSAIQYFFLSQIVQKRAKKSSKKKYHQKSSSEEDSSE